MFFFNLFNITVIYSFIELCRKVHSQINDDCTKKDNHPMSQELIMYFWPELILSIFII